MIIMALPVSHTDRRARLGQLATEWGIHHGAPLLTPLARPAGFPLGAGFRTSKDDHLAEELLKRRRATAGEQNTGSHGSQGALRRAFTTNKKKAWEPGEVFDALDTHVANAGSPGVAEALIAKLGAAGGKMNFANAGGRSNLLARRKSLEVVMQPGRILQSAVEARQTDMVAVLLQYADHASLDMALPLALRSGDVVIAQLLLERGANAAQTAAGQDAFQHLCMTGGHADLVALVLQSDGRPMAISVSQGMVDASRKGCLQTVQVLSRSTADGNHGEAAALKNAVAQCRVDITLAILTGTRPPSPGSQGLVESFKQLMDHPAVGPNEKLAMADALLCAGAGDEVASAALVSAAATGFYPMLELLLSHGASVEHQDGQVLRTAIAQGRVSLVHLLGSDRTRLRPSYASACVASLPGDMSPDDRHAILELLLKKGASGPPLDDALIAAVENCDSGSIALLLDPRFPSERLAEDDDGRKKGPGGMVFDRHAVASVDARDGLALQIAVAKGNMSMAKQLLAARPSAHGTVSRAFSLIHRLSPVARYQMTECFLSTGLAGPCVSEALRMAIEDTGPRRDEDLIRLLLKHKADVNSHGAAGILSAISRHDVNLLDTLLRSQPTSQTITLALAKAVSLDDQPVRYSMVALLLEARPGPGVDDRVSQAASRALTVVLSVKPTDLQLVDLLLASGKADVNFDQGLALVHAIHDFEPAVFAMVLDKGRPNAATLQRGLDVLSDMPTTHAKVAKADALLSRTKRKGDGDLSGILVKEVQNGLSRPLAQRNAAVIRSLLGAGADVNAHNASALCLAVSAVDMPIFELLLSSRPTPTSLAVALPHALHIRNPMERLTFTRRILESGAPGLEANRALVYAIRSFPDDTSLVLLLATKADSGDGEALMSATRQEEGDLVEMLLARPHNQYVASVLDGVFCEAIKAQNQTSRMSMCVALLKAGVSSPVVSDALLAAAAERDMALGTVLIEHGATVEYQDGQAVVEAARAGAIDFLQLLLLSTKDVMTKQTLQRGFQAATHVGDLQQREDIFRLLLEKGVTGEALDAELVSAARFGEDGSSLVRLLLEFGADVNYSNGEAIWTATRSASTGNLELLLGITPVSERQTRPTTLTLLRALKASRKLGKDSRYQVTEWLFHAGLPVTEDIHVALNKAVREEPDRRLVKLLLDKGASPLTNGCDTLIEAAQTLSTDIFALLLGADISAEDASWVWRQAFTPATAPAWLTEKGLEIAQLLLARGVHGDSLSLTLSAAIDAYGTGKDAVARKFVQVLVGADADVDSEDGLVVQKAAEKADAELLRHILTMKPTTRSLSVAFPLLFDQEVAEKDLLGLVTLFTSHSEAGEGLDVMFKHAQPEPILFRAVAKFPRSVQLLTVLLDAGYYHDQVADMQVHPEAEEREQVSLLLWCLLQAEKRVSSKVIRLLIDRGAQVNFVTASSKSTALMAAVESKRADLVKALLLAGAEVDMTDSRGNTPLAMATRVGGDVGTSILSSLLAADPSKNDGSMHHAARELNLSALQVLVDFGHDMDYPSPAHAGRSALGEVCLHAAHAGPLSALQQKQMEKIMTFLLERGTDLTLHSDGQSVLLLAMRSRDPVPTTRILLKVGMWRHINQAFNHYTDGTCTYSPTQYLARIRSKMPVSDPDVQAQLLGLLRANRGADVYYAHGAAATQPDDAVGLPDDVLRADRARRARAERVAREAEDHARTLARTHELAQAHRHVFAQRARLEDDLFAAELGRRRAERDAALRHQRLLAEEGLTCSRLVAEAEAEMEARKHDQRLVRERQLGQARVDHAKALSTVRTEEREEVERLDRGRDARTMGRIDRHKAWVDRQNHLAVVHVAHGGAGPRQIGYVSGELD